MVLPWGRVIVNGKTPKRVNWEAVGVLLAVVSAAAAVGAWVQVTQSTAVQLSNDMSTLQKRVEDLETKISRVRLECQFIETKGQVAMCPDGYLVTGCTAGMNKGSISYERNYCRTQETVDWTGARCCRIGSD